MADRGTPLRPEPYEAVPRHEEFPMRPTAPGKKRRAFTLIELLVVIAIVALLLGMLIPYLGKSKREALILREQVNLRTLGLATATFAGNNKDFVPEPFRMTCAGNIVNAANNSPGIEGSDLVTMYSPVGAANSTPIAKTVSSRVGEVRNAAGILKGRLWGLGQLVADGSLASTEPLFSPDPNSSVVGNGLKASDFAIAKGFITKAQTPGVPATQTLYAEYIYLPYALRTARGDGTWNKYRKTSEMPAKAVVAMNDAFYATNGWQPWHSGNPSARQGDTVIQCVHADGHVARHDTAKEDLLRTTINGGVGGVNGQTLVFGVSSNFYNGMLSGGTPSPVDRKYSSSGSRVVDYLELNP